MCIKQFQHLKVKVEVMSVNLKQATLKTFGFTRCVEHRGEDIRYRCIHS